MNGTHGTETPSGRAADITRGVARRLEDMGYRALAEFPLGNGRRADVIGIDRRGHFALVEVKSSLSDFRSDGKRPEYLPYCDTFYFAVAAAFPVSVLPDGVGIIVADAHHGAVTRDASIARMNAARRKALTVRFARTAVARLTSLTDTAPRRIIPRISPAGAKRGP